jgi:hypothetical protein
LLSFGIWTPSGAPVIVEERSIAVEVDGVVDDAAARIVSALLTARLEEFAESVRRELAALHIEAHVLVT